MVGGRRVQKRWRPPSPPRSAYSDGVGCQHDGAGCTAGHEAALGHLSVLHRRALKLIVPPPLGFEAQHRAYHVHCWCVKFRLHAETLASIDEARAEIQD